MGALSGMGVGLRGSLRLGHKVGKTVGNSRSPQCGNLGFGGLVCVECVSGCACVCASGEGGRVDGFFVWVAWGCGVGVRVLQLLRVLLGGAWRPGQGGRFFF